MTRNICTYRPNLRQCPGNASLPQVTVSCTLILVDKYTKPWWIIRVKFSSDRRCQSSLLCRPLHRPGYLRGWDEPQWWEILCACYITDLKICTKRAEVIKQIVAAQRWLAFLCQVFTRCVRIWHSDRFRLGCVLICLCELTLVVPSQSVLLSSTQRSDLLVCAEQTWVIVPPLGSKYWRRSTEPRYFFSLSLGIVE